MCCGGQSRTAITTGEKPIIMMAAVETVVAFPSEELLTVPSGSQDRLRGRRGIQRPFQIVFVRKICALDFARPDDIPLSFWFLLDFTYRLGTLAHYGSARSAAGTDARDYGLDDCDLVKFGHARQLRLHLHAPGGCPGGGWSAVDGDDQRRDRHRQGTAGSVYSS